MFIEKLKPIFKGYIKAAITKSSYPTTTGGTDEAAYCYSTWMRHLIKSNSKVQGIPESVLELGPGDSLGIGIAALLSGAKRYIGLDILQYWEPNINVDIFDKLVALYHSKAPLADESKYPFLTPYLESYDFPNDIVSDETLRVSLSSTRLAEIRRELSHPSTENKYVQFFSPWHIDNVPSASIDLVFSQAVMQYTDLKSVYTCFHRWLKKGGLTSHSIDFSSHGITKTWNGQWSFSDSEWRHYSYKKKILLNREPLSVHKDLLEALNFEIILADRYLKDNNLKPSQLAQRFKNISDQDLKTHAAFILAIKKTHS